MTRGALPSTPRMSIKGKAVSCHVNGNTDTTGLFSARFHRTIWKRVGPTLHVSILYHCPPLTQIFWVCFSHLICASGDTFVVLEALPFRALALHNVTFLANSFDFLQKINIIIFRKFLFWKSYPLRLSRPWYIYIYIHSI